MDMKHIRIDESEEAYVNEYRMNHAGMSFNQAIRFIIRDHGRMAAGKISWEPKPRAKKRADK